MIKALFTTVFMTTVLLLLSIFAHLITVTGREIQDELNHMLVL